MTSCCKSAILTKMKYIVCDFMRAVAGGKMNSLTLDSRVTTKELAHLIGRTRRAVDTHAIGLSRMHDTIRLGDFAQKVLEEIDAKAIWTKNSKACEACGACGRQRNNISPDILGNEGDEQEMQERSDATFGAYLS